MFPADPPRHLRADLHGYADPEIIDDDLTAAGFTDAVYTAVELTYDAASALDAANGYCLGTDLAQELAARRPAELDRIIAIVAGAIRERFGTARVSAPVRGMVVSAAG
jgi:hypothetical protein